MITTIHVSLDVKGYLANATNAELGKTFTGKGGRKIPAQEARRYLLDRLSEGKLQIPCGPICEGFSYKTGCPGHREEGDIVRESL